MIKGETATLETSGTTSITQEMANLVFDNPNHMEFLEEKIKELKYRYNWGELNSEDNDKHEFSELWQDIEKALHCAYKKGRKEERNEIIEKYGSFTDGCGCCADNELKDVLIHK